MSNYTLFEAETFKAPKTLVSNTTDQEGGTLRIKGGAKIDGKLTGVTIISTDNTPIKISALAELDKCILNGHDVLVEGVFNGEMNLTGDVELGESCTVVGVLKHSGRVLIGSLADTVDLHIVKVAAPKVHIGKVTASKTSSVALGNARNGDSTAHSNQHAVIDAE